MKNYLYLIPLFIFVLIESSITTIPLVLDAILIFYVLKKDYKIFLAAFIAGLFLDIASVRSLGTSSIFFLIFLFIAALYEKKFELKSYYFIFLSSFFGGLVFLIVFGYRYAFFQSIASAAISVFIFWMLMRFEEKKNDGLLYG